MTMEDFCKNLQLLWIDDIGGDAFELVVYVEEKKKERKK